MALLAAFDGYALIDALDAQREALDCSPSRLTNLRTARLAEMDRTMRITQWLGKPAATFVHPARW